MKKKIKILQHKLDHINSKIETLYKKEENISKIMLKIQLKCKHLNYHKLGRESDSQKHLYKCDDCLYVGYITNFK